MKTPVFESIYQAFIDGLKNKGLFELDDILKLARMLQDVEADLHVTVAGQNGVGKSFLMLMLLKQYVGKGWEHNMMLAGNRPNDIITFLLKNEKTMLAVDEWNQFLYYKQGAELEQQHLITTLELARSKRIATVGCIRDPRKLSYNFRSGKMSIVLWLLDRFREGGSVAAVFVASPMIESEDRFGFMYLSDEVESFEAMREMMESLPSFVGYMKVPDARTILSRKELDGYRKAKETAMAYAHYNYCRKMLKKRRMDMEEYNEQIRQLKGIIPIGDEQQTLMGDEDG